MREPSLTFVYSNHVEEEISPCGCGTAPAGGVARRGSVIAHLRRGGRLVVPLDGGNAVSLDVDGGMKKFATLVEAMNLMGYRAATLGSNEVALGRFIVERYDSLALFPLVSANVHMEGPGLLESAVIFSGFSSSAGARSKVPNPGDGLPPLQAIFVTGATEAESVGYGLRISDPVESVERVIRSLPQGALLVVLAHVSRQTATAITALSPQNILVLGYRVTSTDLKPLRPGGAVMGGLSGKGRHLVVTRWQLERRQHRWLMQSYKITTLGLNQKEDTAIAELLKSSNIGEDIP